MIDIFALPIFKDANLLPMLDQEEMSELVASIEANGLRQPIVISQVMNGSGESEMMLIDGRNRREACRLAGVVPSHVVFEGDIDAVKALVIDSDTRRHCTKGQRAMRVAVMYPSLSPRGRGKKVESFNLLEIGKDNLSRARTVLANGPDLAESVLSGAKPLNEAYKEAQARKKIADSEEEKFARLQKLDPDLANLVVEERLTLSEAIGTLDKRLKDDEEREKNGRMCLFEHFADLVKGCDGWSRDEKELKPHIATLRNPKWASERSGGISLYLERFTPETLKRGIASLQIMLKVLQDEK